MKGHILKNLKPCKNKLIKKTTVFQLSSLCLFLVFISCKSVSRAIGDPEVYLYEDQASYLNGTYFVDPYKTNGEFKLLTEIFDLENAQNVSKIDFNFISDKRLHISYSDGKKQYEKIIKGKMKNGAFRYEHNFLPLGIPVILFVYNHKVHHIALGNDDNIIITEYQKSALHFFTLINSNKILNRYYFDRQLK